MLDMCCEGLRSTYNTRVVRSENVTGPYSDAAGVAATENGGTILMQGHDWIHGPGGEFIYTDKDGPVMFYHCKLSVITKKTLYYPALWAHTKSSKDYTGAGEDGWNLGIDRLQFNSDGWPEIVQPKPQDAAQPPSSPSASAQSASPTSSSERIDG
jgi:beta-xylosidase